MKATSGTTTHLVTQNHLPEDLSDCLGLFLMAPIGTYDADLSGCTIREFVGLMYTEFCALYIMLTFNSLC
jgi:hypothetical protein